MTINYSSDKLTDMEYCFCHHCKRIKESGELCVTEKGLQCRKCGSYDLDEPGWVVCPHQKISFVKCPRGGRGIINSGGGYNCIDRCFFRA